MIFDTDILIWTQRGNTAAAELLENNKERKISIYTYMELLQEAQSKKHHHTIKSFFQNYHFEVLALTENIGHRAAIYLEEYAISSGLRAGDALIAATATEHNLTLCSSNKKHFKSIHELKFKCFNP